MPTSFPLSFARGARRRITAGRCTRAAIVAACLGGLLQGGCASIPTGRSAVDAVTVEGVSAIDEDDLLERIATTASPRFLKLWSGVVFDYALYDAYALRRDLARVERFYRARGYYEARARVARVARVKDDHVRVTIVVEEGEPVRVRTVTVRGLEALTPLQRVAALGAVEQHLRRGAPMDEDDYQEAEGALHRSLGDVGYAYAKVTRTAEVDLPRRGADVTYDVALDRPATLGAVTVEGLGALPEDPVRRALDLAPGEPFSLRKLDDAQQAVLNLGVFSSVDVDPIVTDPPPADRVVPVRVRLEQVPLYAVRLGVGAELDMIRTDLHGLAQWEAKNFFGGLRNFVVRDKPGAVFWPTRLPGLQGPREVLPENRLRAELRQPGFLEARTRGTLRAEYNIFSLLLGPQQASASSNVLGYHEVVGGAGLERTFGHVTVAPGYNLQGDFPFAYVGTKPPLGSVIVSYVDVLTTLDLRDDKIHPHKGFLGSLDVQLAGLGGDARDVRVQPDVRGFVPLGKRITLAGRASVGFLFPSSYGDVYGRYAPGGGAYPAEAQGDWTRDLQILFFRGFYSGGTTGNRGYPLRGVGPHGPVPFFNPDVAAQQFASECASSGLVETPGGELEDARSARCLFPLGGATLWEASLEVRIPIAGPFSAVTFCDASDVSSQRFDLRFNRPHLSCGAGARYDTPVGPVRLDVGYRIPGAQTVGIPREQLLDESPSSLNRPESLLFGAFPGAIAFGIGESF